MVATRAETARSMAAVGGSAGFHLVVLCQTVSALRHSRPERPAPREPADPASRQRTEATLMRWVLSALPSAISEVTRTAATKTVERPVTVRRNQRDRAQGNTTLVSTGQWAVFTRS